MYFPLGTETVEMLLVGGELNDVAKVRIGNDVFSVDGSVGELELQNDVVGNPNDSQVVVVVSVTEAE